MCDEIMLKGAFDVRGNHIALVLRACEIHRFEDMIERTGPGYRLLKGVYLISRHAELRGIVLGAVIVPTVPFIIPEDDALNVRLLLVKEERQHFEVMIPLCDASPGRKRIGDDLDQFEAVLVAETPDRVGLFFGGLVLQALLVAFGISAVCNDLVTGTKWMCVGWNHGIICSTVE